MMRRFLILFLLVFSAVASFAQDEGVKPTFGLEIEREVSFAIIEGKTYENVIVKLKVPEYTLYISPSVKVTVLDMYTGEKIYKKRFKKSFLYALPNGIIQVGKGDALIQLVLGKSPGDDSQLMRIQEKGIY